MLRTIAKVLTSAPVKRPLRYLCRVVVFGLLIASFGLGRLGRTILRPMLDLSPVGLLWVCLAIIGIIVVDIVVLGDTGEPDDD